MDVDVVVSVGLEASVEVAAGLLPKSEGAGALVVVVVPGLVLGFAPKSDVPAGVLVVVPEVVAPLAAPVPEKREGAAAPDDVPAVVVAAPGVAAVELEVAAGLPKENPDPPVVVPLPEVAFANKFVVAAPVVAVGVA
jgi:hypothetical protein